ncbi:HEPN/Toprim-associated domain-containing protein [Qipengyuania sp.]|uniref:HEPN/Toprim-associated domain-containing protein n=1 Tax=Qipengyuania sp. TaxID=2004515 RepID=UPI003736C8E0
MGSLIHLAVGRFEVDWGKNNMFRMHGELFQPDDVGLVPYAYWDEDAEGVIDELKEGTSRSLRRVLPRLALLGHSITTAEAEFASIEQQYGESLPITFDQLAEALGDFDVSSPIMDESGDHDFGEFFAREIYVRLGLDRFGGERRAAWDLGYALENLSPASVMVLLGLNPRNLDEPVTWQFADVIEGGWVNREGIFGSLGRVRRFLIVTEGSSDARIIGQGFRLLRPDVADFFSFVDMEEGYPFTGTGNLHRFCQGLVSIGIENRVLVVYDNDAEGAARHRDTLSLRLPPNMRAICLPANDRLRAFCTEGPEGSGISDINGRAAAIECYLDLGYGEAERPVIRWTSYRSAEGVYQGELISKERYYRRFLKFNELPASYDASGLELVLDAIIRACEDVAQHVSPPTEDDVTRQR